MSDFVTKDSGERKQFESGMVRCSSAGLNSCGAGL